MILILMHQNRVEFWIGIVVLIICIVFPFAVFKIDLNKKYNNYYVIFDKADGIGPGTKVSINGYNVGYVKNIELTDKFKCKVQLSIYDRYKFPADSIIEINRLSIISPIKYISIHIGKEQKYIIENNGTFKNVQEELELYSLINKAISLFSK